MDMPVKDLRAQVSPFSGRSLVYTIYRHHHGLTHEQAVMRIDSEVQILWSASSAKKGQQDATPGSC